MRARPDSGWTMFDRPSNAVAFLTILAVCFAGAMRASWWIALAGMCMLVLVSLNNRWRARGFGLGGSSAVADPVQLAASIINAGVIAGASFALGQITGVVWGI